MVARSKPVCRMVVVWLYGGVVREGGLYGVIRMNLPFFLSAVYKPKGGGASPNSNGRSSREKETLKKNVYLEHTFTIRARLGCKGEKGSVVVVRATDAWSPMRQPFLLPRQLGGGCVCV